MRQEEINIYEVVKKLNGNINPAGATHVDDERFENLKDMCNLIANLLADVNHVALHNKDRHEYSMKRAGEYADEFLKNI